MLRATPHVFYRTQECVVQQGQIGRDHELNFFIPLAASAFAASTICWIDSKFSNGLLVEF